MRPILPRWRCCCRPATVVGYAIGYYLDKYFGTTWLQIVFLILGAIGGFVGLIRQITRDSHDDAA
ncbi:MAG: AtpZ/AtpI family protein [Ignavibacteriota bacterium]